MLTGRKQTFQNTKFCWTRPNQIKQNFFVKVFKSEEWLKAERLAKNASKKWLKAGKPRTEDNQIFKAQKETNNQLRQAIQMDNNKETTEENNKMMQANFRDPKLFFKVGKQEENK